MVYTYYSVLYGGFENEKKNGKKLVLSGFLIMANETQVISIQKIGQK